MKQGLGQAETVHKQVTKENRDEDHKYYYHSIDSISRNNGHCACVCSTCMH